MALALATLIAGAVGTFALAWQGRTYASYTEAQLHNDFRYALNTIAHHVRKANAINQGYLSNSYTLTIPDDSSITFGHHVTNQTLWLKKSTFPMCSYVAKFEVDMSEPPLVTLKLTSVDQVPGIKRGLPITITRQVRMRNYSR